MDPFTALGIATNIIALVDFSWTILTEARTIYTSESGVGGEATFLELIARDISRFDDDLCKSQQGRVSRELQLLIDASREITAELLKSVLALEAGHKRKVWSSFVAALKQVWGKDKIKTFLDRLSRLQVRITAHIQLATKNELTELSRAISQLDATNKRLEIQTKENFQSLKSDLANAVMKSSHAQDPFFEQARDYLEAGIGAAKVAPELAQLQSALTRLTGATELALADQKFLESLNFSHIEARHRKIETAHSQTFEWIFEDVRPNQPPINFKEWLLYQNGIFWISGKAGSGKSTLMKFLYHNQITTNCLKSWAGNKKLVVAKFFFWNSGSALQKSQEGLLRSLLFEALRQCPGLLSTVRTVIDISDARDLGSFTWSLENLLLAYRTVVSQDSPMRFCFFVDGLDEFQEENREHRDLIRTLREMDYSDDVKLCVSSRPWTVFEDEFRGSSEWFLRLEDLTRGDIKRYVVDKFYEHPQFKTLIELSYSYLSLVHEVVNRAQGVFLWVYLVVRTLLDGMTYHDSIATLRRRLEEFPPHLEAFFQHLLDSVPKVYHQQTARYFKVATMADEPMHMMMYSFLDDLEEDPSFALLLTNGALPTSTVLSRQDQMRRRLDGRSRGLLEMVKWEDHKHDDWRVNDVSRNQFFGFKVDFLHRTVRDFLHQSLDIQRSFQQALGDESVPLMASHAILAEMKTAPFSQYPPTGNHYEIMALARGLFFFASEATVDPENHPTLETILDEAERVYLANEKRYGWDPMPNLFVGLASQINFRPYLHKKLLANPSLLRSVQDPSTSNRPVLDFALHPLSSTLPVSVAGVTFLLEQGADPNEALSSQKAQTVWGNFLRDISLVDECKLSRTDIYQITKVMLFHGADQNITLISPSSHSTRDLEPKRDRCYDVLARVLTREMAHRLLLEVLEMVKEADSTMQEGVAAVYMPMARPQPSLRLHSPPQFPSTPVSQTVKTNKKKKKQNKIRKRVWFQCFKRWRRKKT